MESGFGIDLPDRFLSCKSCNKKLLKYIELPDVESKFPDIEIKCPFCTVTSHFKVNNKIRTKAIELDDSLYTSTIRDIVCDAVSQKLEVILEKT